MAASRRASSRRAATRAAPKRTRKSARTYKTYISRILKQASKTKMSMSGRAMAITNSFIQDMFEKIAAQAGSLARINRRQTLGSKEIQTAIRLTLPAELAKHAMAEATKAIAKAAA
jgi:histone H2B